MQGVVAHEFSHILNGDMRLNIQLTGLVHGLLAIGLIGEGMMEGGTSTNRVGGGLILLGGSLLIVGYAGTFFGELIKSAVSRQREYLADASAVDFTRNPNGIADALKKIGGLASGSRIRHPRRREISHMFFGQSFRRGWNAEFSTHPPLRERIRRIDPGFSGKYPKVEELPAEKPPAVFAPKTVGLDDPEFQKALTGANQAAREGFGVSAVAMAAAVALVGAPLEPHVDYAKGLLGSMPEALKETARDPYGARALVYALLLDPDAEIRKTQFQRLGEHADATVVSFVHKIEAALDVLDPVYRLPLLDLLMPALHELSSVQYAAFRTNVTELIQADEKVDLFEWVLGHILLRHVHPKFEEIPHRAVQYYSLAGLKLQSAALLSALAYEGHDQPEQAGRAFQAGAGSLPKLRLKLLPQEAVGFDTLDGALDALATASPREKNKLLKACAACIAADEEVTVREAELLRAVADALDCPMPPLLPGQSLVSDTAS